MRILELRRMGNDYEESNVGNYRVRFDCIKLKDEYIETLREGAKPFIYGDFCIGYDHNTKEYNKLYLDSEYQTENGDIFAPIKIERMLFDGNYKYNREDILRFVNRISKKPYDDIKII